MNIQQEDIRLYAAAEMILYANGSVTITTILSYWYCSVPGALIGFACMSVYRAPELCVLLARTSQKAMGAVLCVVSVVLCPVYVF